MKRINAKFRNISVTRRRPLSNHKKKKEKKGKILAGREVDGFL